MHTHILKSYPYLIARGIFVIPILIETMIIFLCWYNIEELKNSSTSVSPFSTLFEKAVSTHLYP